MNFILKNARIDNEHEMIHICFCIVWTVCKSFVLRTSFFFHHLLLRQKWSYHFYKRCNEISALSAPDTYFSFVIRHNSIKNRYHSNHVYNQFILFFSFMQNLKRTQYCFNSKGLAENQRNITSFRRKIDIFSPIFFSNKKQILHSLFEHIRCFKSKRKKLFSTKLMNTTMF